MPPKHTTNIKLSVKNDTIISGLKVKVKEGRLELRDVSIHDLVIWRCVDQATDFDDSEHREILEEQVQSVFLERRNQYLNGRFKIADVRGETLLVQLPAYCNHKRDEGADGALINVLRHFHRESWGKSLDPVYTADQIDPGNDDDPSGDVLPGPPFLNVLDKHFLVRAEYIRTFNGVRAVYDENRRRDLAVVTGQPGIGKTIWIHYAMRRCPGERQDVIWYQGGIFYSFSRTGVEASRQGPYARLRNPTYTWCFVDSTSADRLPTGIYNPLCQLFPIYVTSPKRERWEKLEQLRFPKLIIMNPWTRTELEHARVALYPERTAADVSERFDHAGPMPHVCLAYSAAEIEEFYVTQEREIHFNTRKGFVDIFFDREQNLRIDTLSHLICVVRRSHLVNAPFIVGPISAFIRQRLLTQLRDWGVQDHIDMMRRLELPPEAAGIRDVLFESLFQTRFAQNIHLNAKPMFRYSDPRSRWCAAFGDEAHELNLSILPSERRTYGCNENLEIQENIYYVPRAYNEVAIDSLIVSEGHLYLFQFTVSPHHSVNPRLVATLGQFSGLPGAAYHHLIFIVPDDLREFSCPHSKDSFLRDHVPYAAQVAVC